MTTVNMMDLYQKKYTILKRKCEELHQKNEKLVNRIHHVKKILKRYKKERRMVVEKLDNYNDNFREAEITPMFELPEDQLTVDSNQIKQELSADTTADVKQEMTEDILTGAQASTSEAVAMETQVVDTSPSLVPSSSSITVGDPQSK